MQFSASSQPDNNLYVCVFVCKEQPERVEPFEDESEVELMPSVPSLPLATLLYAPSSALAAEIAEVSPLSAAIARHMGINLSPEGIAARNRRGVAVVVHGAPLSGICILHYGSCNVKVKKGK